jgi:hypothetical protein
MLLYVSFTVGSVKQNSCIIVCFSNYDKIGHTNRNPPPDRVTAHRESGTHRGMERPPIMSEDTPDPFGAREISMPLGIVVEKRRIEHRWASHVWRPVAVLPGAGPIDDWRLLKSENGTDTFQVATLPLILHRKETEAYLANLTNEPPSIYVVLRDDSDADPEAPEIRAVHATASPYEAQDFLDSGEDIVEPVPMPPGVIAWVREFTERHHVEVAFKKRKRKPATQEEAQFGKRLDPIEQRFYDKKKLN